MLYFTIRRADPPDDDEGKKPYDPLDKDADPFGPPDEPVEVGCLHCGGIFMSDQITWRIQTNADGDTHGFWCCPDPACSGAGFGFDLLPTDPNYRDEHGGWVHDDEDEEDDDEFDEDDWNDDKPDGFDPPKDWTGDEEEDIPF